MGHTFMGPRQLDRRYDAALRVVPPSDPDASRGTNNGVSTLRAHDQSRTQRLAAFQGHIG